MTFMPLQGRIKKFLDQHRHLISHLANAITILSFLFVAAIWLAGNFDGFWKLITIIALIAAAISSLRLYYVTKHSIEVENALDDLGSRHIDSLARQAKVDIKQHPELFTVTFMASMAERFREIRNNDEEIDAFLKLLEEYERLRSQQQRPSE